MMSKVTSISKTREKKQQKADSLVRRDGFMPCSPDMTLCGDCQDNRTQNKCPRLKEWLAQRRT